MFTLDGMFTHVHHSQSWVVYYCILLYPHLEHPRPQAIPAVQLSRSVAVLHGAEVPELHPTVQAGAVEDVHGGRRGRCVGPLKDQGMKISEEWWIHGGFMVVSWWFRGIIWDFMGFILWF